MRPSKAAATHAVATGELRAALLEALGCHGGVRRRIVHLERRPYPYSSSYFLEELQLSFEDGSSLKLIYKDLSWHTLLVAAREARPAFLYNPMREIDTYRVILAASGLSTATCYGAAVDVDRDRYWLFLEKVEGVELFQVGEFEIWQQVARWLAGMHTQFAAPAKLSGQTRTAHLLRHDRDYYRLWLCRAQAFVSWAQSDHAADARRRFARLTERYDQVIERLVALPKTIIHGEFYAANVLVAQAVGKGERSLRICPVDWEMAGIGSGLIDLAALTAGRWRDEQQDTLAAAYYAALPANGRRSLSREEFRDALDCCRLHLALQWLGWSQQWTPPTEHAHNWLGEALRLAEKLGL